MIWIDQVNEALDAVLEDRRGPDDARKMNRSALALGVAMRVTGPRPADSTTQQRSLPIMELNPSAG